MKAQLATITTLLFLGACATTPNVRRATVAMKVSDTDAHVSMGAGEVSVGDHVQLYRNVCSQKHSGSRGNGVIEVCKKQNIGHGEIIQLINESYSVIRVPAEIEFKEGDLVEKHMH
ncbi:MAG: hypothetical protein JST16_14615 [Bdellovibrionales bacterium]|nr:hypothetical protein [Bdellovibrionales bacterium]